VVIADSQLDAVIRGQLNKPTGPLTSNDMAGLTQLQAQYRSITNLAGIEAATNLSFLDLGQNEVSDLSPVLQLTSLEILNLSGNRITNAAGLGALIKLNALGLGGSSDWFGLEGVGLSDLRPLSGLTNLQFLSVSGNHIVELGVANLPALHNLDVRDCRLRDMSFTTNFTNITHLSLDGNLLTNIEAVAQFQKLEVLTVSQNLLTNIPPLHSMNLPSLQWVALSYNYIDLNRGMPGRQIIELLLANGKHVEHSGQTFSPRLSLVVSNAPAPGATAFLEFDGDGGSRYAVEEFLDFGIGFWGWVAEIYALPLQTTRVPITLGNGNAILRLRRTEH